MKLVTIVLVAAIISAILFFPLGMMFGYVLNFWIGKDVPFWLDCLGGLATNGFLFVGWVVTLICDYAGYVSPFRN